MGERKTSPSHGGWPSAVVFDLDGTLVDSVDDLANSLNLLLGRHGLAPLPTDAVREMVGGGVRALIARGWRAHGLAPGNGDLDRLTQEFLAIYGPRASARTALYPGASALLARLAGAGHRLGVCTNKPTEISRKILRDLGVLDAFGAMVGGDSGLPRKPAPDMLLATLRRLATSPSEAVLIGDSGADVATARAAGTPVVLVSYGYTATPARTLGADRVIDELSDVPAVLDALAPAKAIRHTPR